MAEKQSYPQIPSTVWWGVRALLQRSPNATINDQLLSAQLNVQPAAAKQYIAELKRVGLLSDENKATEIAEKWRHDDTYHDAVDEILKFAYPEDLVALAPRGDAERQKVIRWFAGAGLGAGTAANKAATYLLICSDSPAENGGRSGASAQRASSPVKRPADQSRRRAPPVSSSKPADKQKEHSSQTGMHVPLNINLQIHISADANADQIEAIFSAMKRYLYDKSDN